MKPQTFKVSLFVLSLSCFAEHVSQISPSPSSTRTTRGESEEALFATSSTWQRRPHMSTNRSARSTFRWPTPLPAHCLAQLPTADIRWAIVQTAGAFHYFHVDSRGEATFIVPLVGVKLWILARPRDQTDLLSTTLWSEAENDVRTRDWSKWDVEMIRLDPGDYL